MKSTIFLFVLMFGTRVFAQTFEFDKLIKNGRGEVISAQGKIDGRYSKVWIPEIHVKDPAESGRYQKVIENPFPVFKERVEKDYLKFLHTSKEFLSCMNEHKWPEERECLKHIDICFNVPRTPTSRYEKCDVWRAEDFKKVCDYRSKMLIWSIA